MRLKIKQAAIMLALFSVLALTASDALAQYGSRDGSGYGKRDGKGDGNKRPGHSYCQHRGKDCPYGYQKRGNGLMGLMGLKEELKLTEAQVLKIMDINHEFRKKAYQNKGDCEKMLENKLEMRKKINTVLNAEQQKKFKTMPFPGRHQPRRGMGR